MLIVKKEHFDLAVTGHEGAAEPVMVVGGRRGASCWWHAMA